MNGKKPLTLDFNTFTTSTGLDYNNGAYVAYPSLEVLAENYSSTEQVNSIQQLITYSLITGTKVDIGEIIYCDLVTKLLNKSRLRYVLYPIFISRALDALLGPEASGALSKKRKQPKSKKTPTLLLSDDEMVQESKEDEVFVAREDMDANTQVDIKFQSPLPNTDKPGYSSVQDTNESTFDSSPNLKKINNILPLTERQLVKYLKKDAIEGYYEENIDHREQTDKVIDAAMNSLDKNSIAKGDILNALYRGLKSLVASPQATETSQDKHLAELAKSSTSIAWNIGSKMISIELSQATIKIEVFSLRKDTSDIKSIMTEIYKSFKIQSLASSSSVPKTALAIFISTYRKIVRPMSYLQDAQPESTRKTLSFSKAVLSE
nr:hypothetical protein [Tanacetum cinerariifolium]